MKLEEDIFKNNSEIVIYTKTEEETKKVAEFILKVLKNIDNDEAIAEVKEEVLKLTEKFPLYKNK